MTPKTPSISEEELTPDILDTIRGCAEDAALLLDLDLSQEGPKEVVEAIDAFLFRWQKGERPQVDEDDDLSFVLGSLWGEQFARAFKWQWAGVTFHEQNDSRAVGVFSPDRALAVYPFHFVYGCIENDAAITILLAYNMLEDGSRIPRLPAGGYCNMMDHFSHIVPRNWSK